MRGRITHLIRLTVNFSILCATSILWKIGFSKRAISELKIPKGTKEIKKDSVLIIKLEVLGDFIIFLPALKVYRELYKGKKLVLLVDHWQNAELAKNLIKLGIIDECIFVDSKRFVKEFMYRFKVSLDLRRRNFETAIYTAYFRRNIGNFLTQVTRARERFAFVGFGIEFDNEPYDKHTLAGIFPMFTKVFELKDYSINEYERNFRLAEMILSHDVSSLPTASRTVPQIEPYFPFIKDIQGNLETTLQEKIASFNLPKKYIVLNPGSGRDYRRWPEDRFAEVGTYALSKGYSVVITGGPNEIELGKKVSEMIKIDSAASGASNTNSVIIVSGKTSATELAAVMKDASAVISNDTGSIHITASVGVPAICIMGCGGYPAFFPYADLSKNIAVVKLSPTCTRAWKCTENEEYIREKRTLAPCVDNVTVEAVNKALSVFL